MTGSEHVSPNPFDALAELRAALGRLGSLNDRDDISDDVYQKANAEYDALFDRVCHAEDDVIAAPISSDAELSPSCTSLRSGYVWGSEVLESLERLQHQVEQYAISGQQ